MKKLSFRFMAQLAAGLALTVIVSSPAPANYGCPGGGRGPGSPSIAPPPTVRPPAPPPAPPTFNPAVSRPGPPPGTGDLQTQTDRMHFKLITYTSLNNEINGLKRQLSQERKDNTKAADQEAYFHARLYGFNKKKEALERDKKYLIKGHPDQQQYATVKDLINKAKEYIWENKERVRLTRANINELETKIRNKEAERDSLMKRY